MAEAGNQFLGQFCSIKEFWDKTMNYYDRNNPNYDNKLLFLFGMETFMKNSL